VVDVPLQLGEVSEKVEVSSSTLRVDTESTQMGEVITGKSMTDVPLVTRSYTDLLSLQPGVAQTASQMSGAYAGPFISAGFAAPLVSGDLNSGAVSVNGMREAENGLILNGILVQELGFSGAGAIPNLDSIYEFRILTNNPDAEYGNYSGGLINVVTKSGTNGYHGNLFEFLRNTDFDAANYFDQGQRSAYHQNQFGGTFGGPIKRDEVFFFADYQGNRVVQGITDLITGHRVPLSSQAICRALKYFAEKVKEIPRAAFVAALQLEGIPCDGLFYETVYKSSLFPVDAADFPALSWGPEKPLDLRNMYSCPESDRAAYHEAVWFPHQHSWGPTADVDAITDAIHKVLGNIEELRGLDQKAIRNQKLGRADRES
jgi:hypothetical protein